MGTRADFYLGRGHSAEWLGSIAYDGHESNLPDEMRGASDEREWCNLVTEFLATRDDATVPTQGWPWPWENSQLTDYSYAFDAGEVWACCFGYGWFRVQDADADEMPDEEKTCEFPDMSKLRNVATGQRSGLLVLRFPLRPLRPREPPS